MRAPAVLYGTDMPDAAEGRRGRAEGYHQCFGLVPRPDRRPPGEARGAVAGRNRGSVPRESYVQVSPVR
ncbi:hypothetical protein ACFVUY_08015 [Kitasatospora sp. NPDC058063]|uniref:hypothetical protein n=1 Tax=unclassified Kitasatospora TaxID=2633591 RepID=UPI0036D970BE